MLNSLKMPTYDELIGLSDRELIRRVFSALGQVDQAEDQGQGTTEKTKIYMVYKNELAKRNYKQRIH